jgi:hypothetical protein
MEARLKLLLAAAAATGAWSAWVTLHPAGVQPVAAVVPSAVPAIAPAIAPAIVPAPEPARGLAVSVDPGTVVAAAPPAPAAPASRANPDVASRPDAFATRDWTPPPPPPPPAPPPVVAPPPPPPAPPPPPTLPYRFVGMLDDPSGKRQRVFLSLGDKLLVAGPGDVLEGGFRLDSIGAQELVFVHVQQNVSVRLSATGGPS